MDPGSPGQQRRRSPVRPLGRLLAAGVAFLLGSVGSGLVVLSPAQAADDLFTDTMINIQRTTSAAGFQHPAVGVTADDLENTRKQVRAGVEPWASYFAGMRASNLASPTYVGLNAGTGVDQPKSNAFDSQAIKDRLRDDGRAAMTQSVMYYITGNDLYRANALKLIRTWSNMDPAKYKYFADAHIHTGIPMYQMLMGAEVLRYTDAVNESRDGYNLLWTDTDTQKLQANLIQPILKTFLYSNNRYMNQHNFGMVGSVAAAIFSDDAELYAQRVEWATVNASFSGDGDINGSIAAVLREVTKENPHNPYGYSFVQNMEMGRDQAHAGADVTNFLILARLMNNHGTRLDPQKGTVSTGTDAVGPYKFLNNRILDGAEAMANFMMGKEIPWIDYSGGSGVISQEYRGRFGTPIQEAYYQYKYQEKVDLNQKAPGVVLAQSRESGPIYYNGTTVVNAWTAQYDGGMEYWLAFPAALAQENVKVPPLPADTNVHVRDSSLALDGNSQYKTEGDTTFLGIRTTAAGSMVSAYRMAWGNRASYAPVGVYVRTNGPATMEVLKTVDGSPYATVTIPDTHGQWRYVTYDIANTVVPAAAVGANIAFYRFKGAGTTVDFEHVNPAAATVLSPPLFTAGSNIDLYAMQKATFKYTFKATDSGAGDTVTYEGAGLPAGAQLSPTTGELIWTPTNKQKGTHSFMVVASDGKTSTALNVTIVVDNNRDLAYQSVMAAGFDATQTYTTASLAPVLAAKAAVESKLESGTDQEFLTALEALRVSLEGLKLLSPRLADGTLAYPGLATSKELTDAKIGILADGDASGASHWGDLKINSATLDFGAAYKVSASSFGIQARYSFANRAQGTNVYGSNDGSSWTLLTERPSAPIADYSMDTIPVKKGLEDDKFRFIRLQIDEPGVANDPAYPGIWSIAEFRIGGDRHETVGNLAAVSLTSPNALKNRVVNGDEVTLAFSSAKPISNVTVRIEGVAATATSTDGLSWTAKTMLGAATPNGRSLAFAIDHTTADGKTADTVYATSDGTALYASNTSNLVDVPGTASVVNISGAPDSVKAAEAARLFDSSITTYTDTRAINGQYYIIWDFGQGRKASLARADMLVRQDQYGTSRLSNLSFEGSNDLLTWASVSSAAQPTPDWQNLNGTKSDTGYRYLRLRNGNIINVAELRIFGTLSTPAA